MRRKDSYRFPFAAFPALRIMLLMALGISISGLYSLPLKTVWVIFSGTLLGWILFEFAMRRRHMIASSRGGSVFYCLFIISASMVLMTIETQNRKNRIEASEPLHLFEWDDLEIHGNISYSGKSSTGRFVFDVDVQETTFPRGGMWKEEYKIRLYADSTYAISAGDNIQAQIRLFEFPSQRNPTGFDYGSWLHRQGISAHGEIQTVFSVKADEALNWNYIRSRLLHNTDQVFEDRSGLAKALLLGYKEDLAPDMKQQFSRAGLSHIMAVSGLHVGFIVAPFWLLIPYLWGSGKGKWLGIIGLSVLLLLYAGSTGFSPSVNRASLMAWLLTYGRLFHKVRNSINLTAVAAIILLIVNPGQLFNAGFQLSFSAVFIILLVIPEAQRLIPQKHRFSKLGGFLTILLVSVVVQLGLFPILIQYFNEFSVTGPVSNALVIPFLSVLVPIGLGVVLFYSILPQTAQLAAIPIELLLNWVQSVASFTGGSEFSYIRIEEISIAVFFIWFFAIMIIASLRIPSFRWKMMIGFLLACNLFFIAKVIDRFQPKELEITFLDVGQGDAIHIKTPGGKHLLVDAGRWSPNNNSGSDVILPYFEDQNIEKLNAVVVSHPHADHIGGLEDVIKQVAVDTIYQAKTDYQSDLYQKYLEVAEEGDIPIKYTSAGDMLPVDPSIRFFVVGPISETPSANANNHSLAFKLVYGKTSALFSGDAEKNQENRLAKQYGEFLESDLYKVGHHASNTSSTVPFLSLVKPDITVASLAFENRYNHPGKESVRRLHHYGGVHHYTSLEGAVVYRSDGYTFRKVNWRNE